MNHPHLLLSLTMRFHLILFAILAGGFCAAPAGSAAAVRTLAFSLPANEVSFEVIAADAEPKTGGPTKTQLDVRVNRFSLPVDLPPGRYLATSKNFKSTDSFILRESAGTRFLLLILPKADGGCAILPIPDSLARIAAGDRFLLNATSEEIAVRFGQQSSKLKPGHSEYLRPPRPAPSDPRIEVEMARLVGSTWIAFNSTYWPLDPRARSFVLVHPDPVTGIPRVRNLSEVPQ